MKIGAFEVREPLPELQEPHVVAMLRPWIDAGNVGSQALTQLGRHLNAQEFAKLERPGTFFDFTRYRPITRVVEGHRSLTVPNTTVQYANREESPDLVFLHLLEPHTFAEDYIESLVELLKALGTKRYIRVGGMYDAVPHTRPLWVTGSLNGQPLEGVAGVNAPRRGSGYQGPTSIMNMVSESLEKEGVESLSLMVHLPQYLELDEDYAGIARLLEILCTLYHLPPELANIQRGERQYQQINEEVEQNARVKALVGRLEAYYDSRTVASAEESGPSLSPQVERFLQDLGGKLGES